MKQLNFLQVLDEDQEVSSDTFDYRPKIINEQDCERYLTTFLRDAPWSQLTTVMYGKEVVTPRLYAWYGDRNVDYSLNGEGSQPVLWTPELLEIRKKVEAISGIVFNSVLLNLYRDQNDSVAWHSDRDAVPGRNQYVASVSFGQERYFDLRQKNDHSKKFRVLLENGSYLLMKGAFQDKWEHRVAKSRIPMKPRINLTFRISHSLK
ncbi:MAG TPA: alpha-ketoglutarate-dependent dioxygenase AlkB [Methylotenera sp.]|nr:alpha-ketoglutarate-dependent dioxygenase AlkB [Methylotenera sp.]